MVKKYLGSEELYKITINDSKDSLILKLDFSETFPKLSLVWIIPFFFISLYVVIGCLLEAGFQELFTAIPFEVLNPFLMSFLLLIIVSFISGVVANTPTALIFIPIIQTLTIDFGPVPLLFSFIIGINLGGNFIPQGAACDMMTLKIARDSGVENMSYKRLFKMGAAFAFIHLGISIIFLLILVPIFG